MDYLDLKKELRTHILLLVGYVCIAVAIAFATLILVYQAYGFGLGKNGSVIQNGLVFFSSQPNPAAIRLNGTLNKAQTNSRVVLPANIYRVELNRDGYRPWQRTIEVEGGDVQHYDYPLLIPKTLTDKKVRTYEAAPGLATQSPDKRWLVIAQPNSMTDFEVYDLKSPDKQPTAIALPANLLSKASGAQGWLLGEWAGDNQHILLQHNFDGKTEFILVDRTAPEKSLNLNNTLSANPTKLTLNDKKFDKYYLYDQPSAVLKTASIDAPGGVTVLDKVLAYQSYGSDTLLYATDKDAPAGKVLVWLQVGKTIHKVRTLPSDTTYLLDLTTYSGDLYVVAGASHENKVYIYKDPIGQLNKAPTQALVPAQVLHVTAPDWLSFSNSAQFIVAEHGTQFGVYDIENERGYNYMATQPLDAPQPHATWMDGNRLAYVSNGRLQEVDYDNTNRQELVPASSSYLPAFTPNYRFMYTLEPAAAAGQLELVQTALFTPADK